MPFLPSPEFIAQVREPPPTPFVNWQPWQRKLFAWGTIIVWLILTGTAGVCLAVIIELPVCDDTSSGLFSSHCHTAVGVGLCIFALGVLCLLYFKYLLLVSRIAYVPKDIYREY
jgi:hypothetical protein